VSDQVKPPEPALASIMRKRPGDEPPERDERLMRRIRSDRIMSTPAQAYREETAQSDLLRLRDAPTPPPGYRYTMDGRLIPIEGSELPITDVEAQELFCGVIEITGSMRAACDALGIRSVARVKGYLMRDVEFSEAVEAASQRHKESLYAHAHKRATVGVETPIFDKTGQLVGYETKYSDSLLTLLLKRHIPEFREASKSGTTVTVNNTDNSQNVQIDVKSMTRAQRDAMRLILTDKSELPEEETVPGTVSPAAQELSRVLEVIDVDSTVMVPLPPGVNTPEGTVSNEVPLSIDTIVDDPVDS